MVNFINLREDKYKICNLKMLFSIVDCMIDWKEIESLIRNLEIVFVRNDGIKI